MGRGAEEASPPVSSSELEQEEDDDDCYLSDQEDDALEESVLQVLEDEHLEDCHWSSPSVSFLRCFRPSRLSPSLDYPDCFLFLTDSFLASCSLQVITKESLLLAQVTAGALPVRFPHYKLFPVLTFPPSISFCGLGVCGFVERGSQEGDRAARVEGASRPDAPHPLQVGRREDFRASRSKGQGQALLRGWYSSPVRQ